MSQRLKDPLFFYVRFGIPDSVETAPHGDSHYCDDRSAQIRMLHRLVQSFIPLVSARDSDNPGCAIYADQRQSNVLTVRSHFQKRYTAIDESRATWVIGIAHVHANQEISWRRKPRTLTTLPFLVAIIELRPAGTRPQIHSNSNPAES